ncbi:MBL fold metallo-hydrolase [Brevibacterium atlanticum]|uniref:MBL fold metallo-hydrolase n=1 Tax=Brevibacterium atlanticum TaxID=2697563 RepID=UPI0014223E4C|nr:MBL fold metallo-hydrolase [Brevibacterium atlanticum]
MVSVHVISLDPAGVSCGLVIGEERCLIVDAGPGPAAARHLIDRVAALSEHEHGIVPPVDLVLTHDHWDHFFGAAALLAAGVETVHASSSFSADQEATAWIALDEVRSGEDLGDGASARWLAQLPEDPGALVVPVSPVDETPGDVGSLDLGDCAVEFHVLGGHSTADLVVRLPEAGIVFAGDLIEEGAPPQAGPDAALSHWADSLRTLLSFTEAEVFVPGHGVPVDRAFVRRQLEDIDGLRMRQDEGDVALPTRAVPGSPDRSIPREVRLF